MATDVAIFLWQKSISSPVLRVVAQPEGFCRIIGAKKTSGPNPENPSAFRTVPLRQVSKFRGPFIFCGSPIIKIPTLLSAPRDNTGNE